ncbi:MAG TPA: phosphate starvation-inducible protein PhoH, partial [Syntrophothermus lipocalidus]|nr:phosphate starvation-inducible protein PhoH [Syntrophothermus lipocalidus]
MSEKEARISIVDNQDAAIFFGAKDANFKYLASICGAGVSARGADIIIKGQEEEVDDTFALIHSLLDIVKNEKQLTITDINYMRELLKRGEQPRHLDIVSG